MLLQPGEKTEVRLIVTALKVFTDCPRLKIATSKEALMMKIPVTFLRFSRPVNEPHPEGLLKSLSGEEVSEEFIGLNPAYKSLATLGEGLSFDGRFAVLPGTKVPSLGRTGILLVSEVLGKLVLCKVVLRPDASGGVVTALSQSTKLRREVLSLVLGQTARPLIS